MSKRSMKAGQDSLVTATGNLDNHGASVGGDQLELQEGGGAETIKNKP